MSRTEPDNRFRKLADTRREPDARALEQLLAGPPCMSCPLTPPRKTPGGIAKTGGCERALIQIVTSPEVRAEFRTLAASRDMKMNGLFHEMFAF